MVGVELVRLLASQGDRIFSTERARELAPRVGIKDSYLCEALYHLRQNDWIVPIRRGLYYLRYSAYHGEIPAHEFEIAMNLASPAAISHWSAMNHHGLNEQIPRTIFVLTTTESSVPRKRGIKRKDGYYRGYRSGNAAYKFIQVKPEYFFGTEEMLIGTTMVSITDQERTLLDGLCRPQYCGGFAEALYAFNAVGDELNIKRIVEHALRLSDAMAKRLGWVLEYWDYDFSEFRELAELPVKGYRKLDPLGPAKGPCNSRWMIQENLPGNIMSS